MPVNGEKNGTFSRLAADEGIHMSDIPGDGGMGPIVAVVFLTATGDPNSPDADDITLQLFPSGRFTQGLDSNGNISVTCTFTNEGNDKDFGTTGGGTVNMEDGFWNQRFRGVLNTTEINLIEYTVQFLSYEFSDFAGSGPPQGPEPDEPTAEDLQFDEETQTGSVTIVMTQDESGLPAETTSLIIEIAPGSNPAEEDFFIWASMPFEPGVTDQPVEFVDYAFEPGTWTYRVRNFNPITDFVSDPSPELEVTFGEGLPSLIFTMGQTGGFIDMGGTATVILQADPSGIYTMVPGKTNDTLYDRSVSPVTTTDYAIPEPFIKTGFLE